MKPQSSQKTTKQHSVGLIPSFPRKVESRNEQTAQEKRFLAEKPSEDTRKVNKRTTHAAARKRSVNRTENDGCDHLL